MSLLSENTRRWKAATFKPQGMTLARKFAQRAMRYKDRYIALVTEIERRHHLIVPWWVVPLIHERECGCTGPKNARKCGVDNWSCNIGQGKPFNVKSNIKPYNGPFTSWTEAAIAALVKEAPFAAKNTNWSAGGVMTINEAYNGLGYARMGRPSPYIWAWTNQYVSGKYIADGKYDPKHVDTQLGVAIALKALMELDPTIQLDGDLPKQDIEPRKTETAVAGGFFATVLAFINSNPWFVLTWWDIAGIVTATAILTGIAIYYIVKRKKSL